MKLLESGQYDKSTQAFLALEDYKDASTQALEVQYQKG